VKSTFLAQICFPTDKLYSWSRLPPKLAICSSTSHGPKQELVDLNHCYQPALPSEGETLLDSLGSNPVSCSGTRIHSDDNPAVETECQGCRSMGELDVTVGIDVVVDMASEEGCWVCDRRQRERWKRRVSWRKERCVFVRAQHGICCIDRHILVKNRGHSSCVFRWTKINQFERRAIGFAKDDWLSVIPRPSTNSTKDPISRFFCEVTTLVYSLTTVTSD
jgi:hypothetical protein